MRILVTHLTRMARGFCCVAGVAEGDHRHIRPVIGQRLTTDLLVPSGPFDMGAIVELDATYVADGRPPEVEDVLFVPERASRQGYVGAARLWEILDGMAQSALVDIFGGALEQQGQRASVALMSGEASLGALRPAGTCQLVTREGRDGPSIRILLATEGLDLSLTDARYYRDELTRPDIARVQEAQRELHAGRAVILGVGLTRPFARAKDEAERHWLQVNALHISSIAGLRLNNG